ncbi:hypothetical protein ACFWIB_14285 [Streptomyces sp. NPDC127051]|uniref:hypothetical protein n=1 Tax=Streptomyces sp. NPDC127051 TaxID=3347119 RepID=UPI003662B66E
MATEESEKGKGLGSVAADGSEKDEGVGHMIIKYLFKKDDSAERLVRDVLSSLEIDPDLPPQKAREKAGVSNGAVCASLRRQGHVELGFLILHALLEYIFYAVGGALAIWAGYRVLVESSADADFVAKALISFFTFAIGFLFRQAAQKARRQLHAVHLTLRLFKCNGD